MVLPVGAMKAAAGVVSQAAARGVRRSRAVMTGAGSASSGARSESALTPAISRPGGGGLGAAGLLVLAPAVLAAAAEQERWEPEGAARRPLLRAGGATGPALCLQRMITDVYKFDDCQQPVGRGSRSTVSVATHRRTGSPVAVKQIPRRTSSECQVKEEVRMLKEAGDHPNVVQLRGFFEDADAYYIVMEICAGGELYDRLAEKGRYSEGQAARIMVEVLGAIAWLHSKSIVHFDIKPENIMLAVGDDLIPEVKLADFGSAFSTEYPVGEKDYTVAYSAPEVLTQGDVTEKVDVWACGAVMYTLLTGRHPFDTSLALDEEEVARRVTSEDPDLQAKAMRHVSPEAKDLLRRLLAKDPKDRPTALQALNHPWLEAVKGRWTREEEAQAPAA